MEHNFNQISHEMNNIDFLLDGNHKQNIVLNENEISSFRKPMNIQFKAAISISNDYGISNLVYIGYHISNDVSIKSASHTMSGRTIVLRYCALMPSD